MPDNINSLGNLISIEKRSNMLLSNKMPQEKYNVYKDEHTGRPHIADLLKENEEEQFKNWGQEQIENRTYGLANILYENIFCIYIKE